MTEEELFEAKIKALQSALDEVFKEIVDLASEKLRLFAAIPMPERFLGKVSRKLNYQQGNLTQTSFMISEAQKLLQDVLNGPKDDDEEKNTTKELH